MSAVLGKLPQYMGAAVARVFFGKYFRNGQEFFLAVKKGVHQSGLKLFVPLPRDDVAGLGRGLGLPVNAGTGQRVIGVRQGHNARAQGNGLAFYAQGVA